MRLIGPNSAQTSTLTLPQGVECSVASSLVADVRELLSVVDYYPGCKNRLVIEAPDNLLGQDPLFK